MSVFDSILGLGSSAPVDQGAMFAANTLDATNASNARVLRKTVGQANDALTTNATAGLDALKGGYDSAIAALGGAGTQAQGLLAKGVQDATGTVLGGNAAFSPYVTTGQGATTMLGNAYGLNGPAGNDAATAAFHASPAYQFQQDQASDATARKAASLGLGGSGSTLSAILDQSSRLANSEYGNWLSGLQGLGGQGLSAANAISSNNQTAGGYQYGGGTAGAQIAENTGSNIANANVGRGTGQAGIYGNLGQGLSSNYTGLGQNIAQTNLQTGLAQANLEMQQGQLDATAANTNNSILSGMIGKVLGLPLGGNSLSSPSTGGFNVTPLSGSSGGFSVTPGSGGSTGSGGSNGFFGSLINNAGTSLGNFGKNLFS